MTFTVAHGEIVGIIGPNGAGKTTLFDLISGSSRRRRSCRARRARHHAATRPPSRARRGLGRSFQDARLFPDMTVRRDIAVVARAVDDKRSVSPPHLRFPTVFDDEERTTHGSTS